MELFSVYPKVKYPVHSSTNLLVSIAAIKQHLKRFEVYYPYTIKDGERPDTIAWDYYGSSSYEWIVKIPNDILDVYYDWPLDGYNFNKFLLSRYGQIHELHGIVHHYKYVGKPGETAEEIARKSWTITPETWQYSAPDEKVGWEPVSVFDWEYEKNESKRKIKLLAKKYVKQAEREVKVLFGV